jgi:cell division septation protein DedD
MPTLHNPESEQQERNVTDYRDQRPQYRDRDLDEPDREISLGTGTILGIFFALALVCALFFGLGYSMGRKSAQTAAQTTPAPTPAPSDSASNNFTNFKPSAGSPVPPPGQVPQPKQAPEAQSAPEDQTPPADPDATIVTEPVSRSQPRQQESSARPKPSFPHPSTPQPPTGPTATRQASQTAATPTAPAMPAITPNGTTMVQVAAVSHQEDADVLISALKKRGYAVFIRQEPQDHLLHVQIGPFATRKDADAMRQRLLADGYNAIVK